MDPKQYGAGRGLISPRMGDQWRAAFNTIVSHCVPEKKKGGGWGVSENVIVARRVMPHVYTGQPSMADLEPKKQSFCNS